MVNTATRVEERRLRSGSGLETLVDITAVVVFVWGCLTSFFFLLPFSFVGTMGGISSLLATAVVSLLLRCLAEHLRLQKSIAGLEFVGRISGPQVETIWACGKCGQVLYSDDRCESCGAEIVEESTT